MAAQLGEPLSPWAQRYGVLYKDESTLEEGKLRHSGYHTGHPRLDPKFYAEPILQAELDNCALFNHKNDIHRLFHIEHKQYGSFKGIRPWQYGPLMQYVRFSDRGLLPGGHWRPEVWFPKTIRFLGSGLDRETGYSKCPPIYFCYVLLAVFTLTILEEFLTPAFK